MLARIKRSVHGSHSQLLQVNQAPRNRLLKWNKGQTTVLRNVDLNVVCSLSYARAGGVFSRTPAFSSISMSDSGQTISLVAFSALIDHQ